MPTDDVVSVAVWHGKVLAVTASGSIWLWKQTSYQWAWVCVGYMPKDIEGG